MPWSWSCGWIPATRPIPSQARGLLLLRARDPALLDRLIVGGQRGPAGRAASWSGWTIFRRGETTYHVREFPAGSGRPPEWYVGYPDGTFAFSNSEEMIQGVVDRKPPVRSGGSRSSAAKPGNIATGPGLGDLPRADRPSVDGCRSGPWPVCTWIPARSSGCWAMAPRAAKPSDARVLALLERHLAAVEYAGAALVWRSDAIVVHAVETLDPVPGGWLAPPLGGRCAALSVRSSVASRGRPWPSPRCTSI